jgi:hypothetical protein
MGSKYAHYRVHWLLTTLNAMVGASSAGNGHFPGA